MLYCWHRFQSLHPLDVGDLFNYSPLDRHILLILIHLRRRSHGNVIQADENDNGCRYYTDPSCSTSEYFNCHDCTVFVLFSQTTQHRLGIVTLFCLSLVYMQFVSLFSSSLQLTLLVVRRSELKIRMNRFHTLFRSINECSFDS